MILLIWSIIVLVSGKYKFSKNYGIAGTKARICAIVTLILSSPFIYIQVNPEIMRIHFPLTALEIPLIIFVLFIAILISGNDYKPHIAYDLKFIDLKFINILMKIQLSLAFFINLKILYILINDFFILALFPYFVTLIYSLSILMTLKKKEYGYKINFFMTTLFCLIMVIHFILRIIIYKSPIIFSIYPIWQHIIGSLFLILFTIILSYIYLENRKHQKKELS